MKKLTAALTFLLILTLCESSFALNDREYYDMKKDPFFRASDKKLTKLIEELKTILPDKDYKELRESHKEWLASGLDRTAENLIANNNISKVDAYVQATEGRIKDIERRRSSDSAKDEIAESEKDIAVLENEIKHNNERIAEIKKLIEESRRSAEEFEKQIAGIESEKRECSEHLAAVQSDIGELERELKERGLWRKNNVIAAGDKSDNESDEGGETLTLYDEANNKEEPCWHFIHGEDFPDYISAINDYYVSMNDGAVYVLDTFDDVVRPIDEAEL